MLKTHMLCRLATSLSALALAGAGVTACGGSSGSTHTSASSSATTSASSALARSTGASSTAAPRPGAPANSTPLATLRARLAHSARPVAPTPQASAFRNALTSFASCLRSNGVKIPAPNTHGGPVLSTRGLNTNTPQYRAALAKCRSVLVSAFRQATRSTSSKQG